MTLALNGIRASSVRRIAPWSGAWAADAELDLGELLDLPTVGRSTLIVDKAALVGTIDPAQSGRKGPRASARVVAGGGGWEKIVSPKAYHNDGGVFSTVVLSTTAAEVGEVVTELAPSRLGVDYERIAGPASSVLDGLPWHVDASGVTVVGPRVPRPALPTLQILDWDPRTKVATLADEAIIEPGTILTDPRFGTAMIRDVEQVWSDSGARATAWTVPVDEMPPDAAGNELFLTLGAIANHAVGASTLATYLYRVTAQGPDGRLTMVPVKPGKLPALKLIALSPAVPGMTVKVPPGTVCHVEFVGPPEDRRSSPRVVRFERSSKPIEVSFDASVRVAIGQGTAPIVKGTAAFVEWMSKVTTALNALAPGSAVLPPDAISTKGFTE